MIRLLNPTDESLVLSPHSSNTANFNLELGDTKQILLAASGLLEVPVKFTPSAIGQLHSAEISFHCPQVIHFLKIFKPFVVSQASGKDNNNFTDNTFTAGIICAIFQLGSWIFLASGTGMMPGPVDPVNIYSQLGGNSSVIIPFENPTERQVIVDVVMKEQLPSRSGKFSL